MDAKTERSFYGTEFEVQLKNKLTQRAIASECADWMRRKAKFRSNSGGAPMQQFAAVQAASATGDMPNAVYMPLHGFTAVDLGYQPGNAVWNIGVTIARSRKHIETFYDTKEIGTFPERLKPLSSHCPLTARTDVIGFNDIFNQLSLMQLAVYAPVG